MAINLLGEEEKPVSTCPHGIKSGGEEVEERDGNLNVTGTESFCGWSLEGSQFFNPRIGLNYHLLKMNKVS